MIFNYVFAGLDSRKTNSNRDREPFFVESLLCTGF